MPTIHPAAIVHPGARLADGVAIGPFTIVEEGTVIGEGTRVDAHCLIASGARIGRDCRIHQGTVVATPPQDLKFGGEETEFLLGDRCVIREYCTLNRGTRHSGRSSIGPDSFLMAYCHVAHDCSVGPRAIFANGVQLGGHCEIGEQVTIGGLTGVHQFSHIGDHAMVASGIKVAKDIPPYALAAMDPVQFQGLNSIGLRRRGFTPETIALLKRTYDIIYYAGMNVSQALAHARAVLPPQPEVENVLAFIERSARGIMRPARRAAGAE
jgi:UDP-N-acetylglucosamine acyltransferase